MALQRNSRPLERFRVPPFTCALNSCQSGPRADSHRCRPSYLSVLVGAAILFTCATSRTEPENAELITGAACNCRKSMILNAQPLREARDPRGTSGCTRCNSAPSAVKFNVESYRKNNSLRAAPPTDHDKNLQGERANKRSPWKGNRSDGPPIFWCWSIVCGALNCYISTETTSNCIPKTVGKKNSIVNHASARRQESRRFILKDNKALSGLSKTFDTVLPASTASGDEMTNVNYSLHLVGSRKIQRPHYCTKPCRHQKVYSSNCACYLYAGVSILHSLRPSSMAVCTTKNDTPHTYVRTKR